MASAGDPVDDTGQGRCPGSSAASRRLGVRSRGRALSLDDILLSVVVADDDDGVDADDGKETGGRLVSGAQLDRAVGRDGEDELTAVLKAVMRQHTPCDAPQLNDSVRERCVSDSLERTCPAPTGHKDASVQHDIRHFKEQYLRSVQHLSPKLPSHTAVVTSGRRRSLSSSCSSLDDISEGLTPLSGSHTVSGTRAGSSERLHGDLPVLLNDDASARDRVKEEYIASLGLTKRQPRPKGLPVLRSRISQFETLLSSSQSSPAQGCTTAVNRYKSTPRSLPASAEVSLTAGPLQPNVKPAGADHVSSCIPMSSDSMESNHVSINIAATKTRAHLPLRSKWKPPVPPKPPLPEWVKKKLLAKSQPGAVSRYASCGQLAMTSSPPHSDRVLCMDPHPPIQRSVSCPVTDDRETDIDSRLARYSVSSASKNCDQDSHLSDSSSSFTIEPGSRKHSIDESTTEYTRPRVKDFHFAPTVINRAYSEEEKTLIMEASRLSAYRMRSQSLGSGCDGDAESARPPLAPVKLSSSMCDIIKRFELTVDRTGVRNVPMKRSTSARGEERSFEDCPSREISMQVGDAGQLNTVAVLHNLDGRSCDDQWNGQMDGELSHNHQTGLLKVEAHCSEPVKQSDGNDTSHELGGQIISSDINSDRGMQVDTVTQPLKHGKGFHNPDRTSPEPHHGAPGCTLLSDVVAHEPNRTDPDQTEAQSLGSFDQSTDAARVKTSDVTVFTEHTESFLTLRSPLRIKQRPRLAETTDTAPRDAAGSPPVGSPPAAPKQVLSGETSFDLDAYSRNKSEALLSDCFEEVGRKRKWAERVLSLAASDTGIETQIYSNKKFRQCCGDLSVANTPCLEKSASCQMNGRREQKQTKTLAGQDASCDQKEKCILTSESLVSAVDWQEGIIDLTVERLSPGADKRDNNIDANQSDPIDKPSNESGSFMVRKSYSDISGSVESFYSGYSESLDSFQSADDTLLEQSKEIMGGSFHEGLAEHHADAEGDSEGLEGLNEDSEVEDKTILSADTTLSGDEAVNSGCGHLSNGAPESTCSACIDVDEWASLRRPEDPALCQSFHESSGESDAFGCLIPLDIEGFSLEEVAAPIAEEGKQSDAAPADGGISSAGDVIMSAGVHFAAAGLMAPLKSGEDSLEERVSPSASDDARPAGVCTSMQSSTPQNGKGRVDSCEVDKITSSAEPIPLAVVDESETRAEDEQTPSPGENGTPQEVIPSVSGQDDSSADAWDAKTESVETTGRYVSDVEELISDALNALDIICSSKTKTRAAGSGVDALDIIDLQRVIMTSEKLKVLLTGDYEEYDNVRDDSRPVGCLEHGDGSCWSVFQPHEQYSFQPEAHLDTIFENEEDEAECACDGAGGGPVCQKCQVSIRVFSSDNHEISSNDVDYALSHSSSEGEINKGGSAAPCPVSRSASRENFQGEGVDNDSSESMDMDSLEEEDEDERSIITQLRTVDRVRVIEKSSHSQSLPHLHSSSSSSSSPLAISRHIESQNESPPLSSFAYVQSEPDLENPRAAAGNTLAGVSRYLEDHLMTISRGQSRDSQQQQQQTPKVKEKLWKEAEDAGVPPTTSSLRSPLKSKPAFHLDLASSDMAQSAAADDLLESPSSPSSSSYLHRISSATSFQQGEGGGQAPEPLQDAGAVSVGREPHQKVLLITYDLTIEQEHDLMSGIDEVHLTAAESSSGQNISECNRVYLDLSRAEAFERVELDETSGSMMRTSSGRLLETIPQDEELKTGDLSYVYASRRSFSQESSSSLEDLSFSTKCKSKESSKFKSKCSSTSAAITSSTSSEGNSLSSKSNLRSSFQIYSHSLKQKVRQLQMGSVPEQLNALTELNVLMEQAWSMPIYGKDLAYELCDILRTESALDIIVNNLASTNRELMKVSARLLEQSLTTSNRRQVAENGLELVVKMTHDARGDCELAQTCTGILESLFKTSEDTCARVIKLGGLDTITYWCRCNDRVTLKNCAIALSNLALYGGGENQQEMAKHKVPEWLFPLAFVEDDSVRYYALLAIGVLVSNKEIENAVMSSGTLALVLPFIDSHDPAEFAQRDMSHRHGRSPGWLKRLIPVLSSKREEAQALAAFHFVMEAGIKSEQGRKEVLYKIGAVEPLKWLASTPNRVASKLAAQALKIIGEEVPHKLSQQVPLWTCEDVAHWISQGGFSSYADKFQSCQVDGDLLLRLTEEELIDSLGMNCPITRKRFLRELRDLKISSDYTSCDPSMLGAWLCGVGEDMSQYTYQMLHTGVDRPLLRCLKDNHLYEDCKVVNGIHRMKILAKIEELRSSLSSPSSAPYDSVDGMSSVSSHRPPIDVFISYRRSNGSQLASLLKVHLQLRGFTVFIDIEKLRAGKFDESLLESVKQAKNFIIVLTPNSLDRCMGDTEKKDWVHREITAAIEAGSNIIPLIDNFKWPSPDTLPEDMRNVCYFNAVRWIHDYQDACVDKLEQFLRGETNAQQRHPASTTSTASGASTSSAPRQTSGFESPNSPPYQRAQGLSKTASIFKCHLFSLCSSMCFESVFFVLKLHEYVCKCT
ncbi:hypothetical protein Btru_002393 [Bulinus truncatus]|nr:hypothetical protein Btru_002393 [Bulinus truncatus]